jgi:hypothetical protein
VSRLYACRAGTSRGLAWLLPLLIVLPSPWLSGLTITEVFYHPAAGDENLEFVEIYNETGDPVDLTGYYFSRGIDFVVTERTFLGGREYLVICADAQAVRSSYGIENAIGDWNPETALANGGEALELMTSSGTVAAGFTYNDRGKWPAGADGTGHSLAMVNPHRRPGTSANWALSGTFRGTPGAPNDTALAASALTINEISLTTAEQPGWIEFYNAADMPIELAGFHLSRRRDQLNDATLAAGTVIEPRGWLVLSQEESGIELVPDEGSGRLFVVLSQPGGERVVDAASVASGLAGVTVARVPDGTRGFETNAVPTPGGANRTLASDAVVINEIHYHPLDNDPNAEFLELLNRGTESVVVGGWRFIDGIRFDLPPETTIPAGQFLVVARDPALIAERYGLASDRVVGPVSDEALAGFGTLADGGERVTLVDGQGNTVDTLRYEDGGEWPVWADGEGSSLELIDPAQDNAVGQAWDASDDSSKAEVTEIVYHDSASVGESEFHIAMGDSAIAMVDDVSVRERSVVLANEHVLFDFPTTWRFFKGLSAPSEPADAWVAREFDDSAWPTGGAVFGYGARAADEVTVLDDMRGNYVSVFFRVDFEVDEARVNDDVILSVEYDDGFAAYINGQEVAIDNLPDGRAFDIDAGRTRSRTLDFRLPADSVPLVVGRNVVAIQMHNSSINNVDLRFAARMATGQLDSQLGENLVTDGAFDVPDEEVPNWPRGARNPSWRIQGTHLRSGRVEEGALSGAGSLKVVASGKGDNKVNRIETTNAGLTRLQSGAELEISLLARWIIGSPVLMTHGAYAGIAPASFAKSHMLSIPQRLGSPGAENSVTQRQVARGGSANVGPLIWEVRHDPAVPDENEPVAIQARIHDPDGVVDPTLHYTLQRPRAPGDPELLSVPLEGPDADGLYRTTVPGQPLNTTVVFFVSAADTSGALGRYPLDHLSRSHPLIARLHDATPDDSRYVVYRHQSPAKGGNRLAYRFWVHDADEEYLATRVLLSNDLVNSTMVFEEQDLYYNTKIRFSGSPFARQRWSESYRVRMPKDQPLIGRIQKFGLEDHQGAGGLDARERVSSYLISNNQGDTRVPFGEAFLVDIWVNQRVRGSAREHMEVPSRDYLSRWFPGDDDGPFFEVDDRHIIDDGGNRADSQDGRLLAPPYAGSDPNDKEDYRFYFTPRGKNTTDDFDELISLAKFMTPGMVPDDEYEEKIWDRINVEEFLRIWSIRLNTDDWDTWGARRGKNCYLYLPPDDGRWVLLPWDMELTYGDTFAFPLPNQTLTRHARISNQFGEVGRLLNTPSVQRLYYSICLEMTEEPFNSEFLTPFMDRLAAVGMARTSVGKRNGFIDQRRNRLLRATAGIQQDVLELEILTNLGFDLTTMEPSFALVGRAPLEARRLVVVVNGVDDPESVPRFENIIDWSVGVPLREGRNEVTVLGFDRDGEVVASDSIAITRLSGSGNATFVRGDANLNGRVDIVDAIWTFLYLQGTVAPLCLDALDTDDSGDIGITDIVRGLDFLFRGGVAPAAPYPTAGPDLGEDELDCAVGVVES